MGSNLRMRMSSSMRWRNGETVGVETSMVLLLSVNEADCLDHQHRRTSGTTDRQRSYRSAYRASGLVRRPIGVGGGFFGERLVYLGT